MNIFIDGNIASGKSTLLNLIKPYFENKNEIVQKPINEWLEIKNIINQNILELFYRYPNKYSFSFQILTMITRLETINNQNQILERSPECDKNVFVKNCYNQGFINDVEYDIYQRFYNFVNKKRNNKYIYLKTSPRTCLKRVLKRDRNEEVYKVNLDYLTEIEYLHDEFFKNTEHLVLDGNEDFENNEEILLKFVKQIKNYIST